MDISSHYRTRAERVRRALTEIEGVCRDPADDVILATAIAAKAAWLVTGDQDLLVLEAYEGIAIVSPRQMLAQLEPPAEHSDS
jgi:predicted nucleic acid-binding protein